MSRRPKRSPVTVGRAVAQVLAELGHGGASEVVRIAARWEEAVGSEIAAHAEPSALRGGVLEVTVESSVWCQHLQLRRLEILSGLSRVLGADAPAHLRFRVG